MNNGTHGWTIIKLHPDLKARIDSIDHCITVVSPLNNSAHVFHEGHSDKKTNFSSNMLSLHNYEFSVAQEYATKT